MSKVQMPKEKQNMFHDYRTLASNRCPRIVVERFGLGNLNG